MLLLTKKRFFIERHNVEMANMRTMFVSATMNMSFASIPGVAYNFINPSYKVYVMIYDRICYDI
jgi:hypothetical protein